jgi:hypothetical protein
MNKSVAPLGIVLGIVSLPAIANEQTKPQAPLTVGTFLPAPAASVSPTSPSQTTLGNSTSDSDGVSLPTHLSLHNGQMERLGRIYDEYAKERIKQEKKLDEWQSQLKIAQEPATFNEGKASRLMRDINQAQQKVANSFLKARSKALGVLDDTQRIQLHALASDPKIKVRTDMYFQLLLLAPVDFWRLPIESNSEQRLLSERDYNERKKRNDAIGTYGVYAGYGWGRPDYGIYGGFGRDGVGVNVGIGRGGPSVGVNIGSIFRIGR